MTTAVGLAMVVSGLVGAATWGRDVAGAQDAQGESSPVEAGEVVATGQAVIADGHVDVGPKFVDGEWTLLVRDDTVDPSVWRRLPDVVLQATDAAVLQVPDDPRFGFLGPPGTDVWVLPQVQQPGILWPGWNTQDPEVATTIDREATWTLHGVDGPGDFVLFFNRDFGQPETVFDSRQPSPQELGIEANTHAHGNWSFTAPGVYLLDVEMSTATADGEALSARGTLRIAVGDTTNPDDAFAVETGDDTSTETSPDPADNRSAADAASQPPADADDDSAPLPWLAAGAAALLALGIAVGVAWRVRTKRQAATPDEPPAAGSPNPDAAPTPDTPASPGGSDPPAVVSGPGGPGGSGADGGSGVAGGSDRPGGPGVAGHPDAPGGPGGSGAAGGSGVVGGSDTAGASGEAEVG